jgi:hypothetical protein
MSSYILETLASQRSAEVARRSTNRTDFPEPPTRRRRRIPRVEWQLPARARRAVG